MSRFCVSWSNHNWIRSSSTQLNRTCSKCGTVEPRPANRPEPGQRRRHGATVDQAVSTLAQAKPCPRNDGGEHKWRPGRGYDFCDHCGLVLRDPLTTVAPPEQPTYKVSKSMRTRLEGLGIHTQPHPSAKALQRRRGKLMVLFARDGNGCFYCRIELETEDAVLDHFIPRSAGGPDELENRRASCVRCDKAKRDRMPWVFQPGRFEPPDGWTDSATSGA